MRTQQLANKIIKMFIDEKVPLSIQLASLKLAISQFMMRKNWKHVL